MLYLEAFTLPGIDAEERILNDIRETYYVSFYPFGLFPTKELDWISFDPVTIFYGGNGSGKTTLINVIAEKLRASRSAPYNKSSFFDTFVEQCTLQWEWQTSWQDATVITSDDVFEYIFDLRAMNEGVDNEREKLAKEYLNLKNSRFRLQSLADYEQLKKVNAARRGAAQNPILYAVRWLEMRQRDLMEKARSCILLIRSKRIRFICWTSLRIAYRLSISRSSADF